MSLQHDQAAAIAQRALQAYRDEIEAIRELIPADRLQAIAVNHASEAALIAYSEILCPACKSGLAPKFRERTGKFYHGARRCTAGRLRAILLAWSYYVR